MSRVKNATMDARGEQLQAIMTIGRQLWKPCVDGKSYLGPVVRAILQPTVREAGSPQLSLYQVENAATVLMGALRNGQMRYSCSGAHGMYSSCTHC